MVGVGWDEFTFLGGGLGYLGGYDFSVKYLPTDAQNKTASPLKNS